MSLFDYVPLMKEINNGYSTAGIIILIVFLVTIILKMLTGMNRGIIRQLIRTALTVGAAVISFITAELAGKEIVSSIDEGTVEGVLNYLKSVAPELANSLNDIVSAFPADSIAKIMVLPATVIVVPITFILVFLLVKMVITIVCAMLIKIIKFKKVSSNVQRFVGALLGAVEAVIYLTVVLLPFTGVIGVIGDSYDSAIYYDGGLNQEIASEYTATYLPIVENPAVKLMSDIGGDAMATQLSTVKIDGKKSDLRSELVPVIRFAMIDCKSGKIDFKNLDDKDKEAINRFIAGMEDSPYLADAVCSLVKGSTYLIESGKIIDMGETGSAITDALFGFLGGFSAEHFTEDLNTVKDLYFALSDHGILVALTDSETDLMTLLGEHHDDGSSAVSSLVTILQSNPRTAPLVRAITDLLLSNLTGGGVEGAPEVNYEELKTDVEKVLSVKEENYDSEEEYKEALSSVLDSTLKDHGIELEEEIVDGIADYVDENFSEVDTLTDEEFNGILLHYYEASQEYVNSGEIPEGVIPDGVLPE